jgi:NAD dependent epimerase/dehydratase family enzyme
MTLWALGDTRVSGPLNLTAPNPVTNAELAQAMGRAMHRPSFVPAPAFAVRMLVGEMADAAILNGQCVIPTKALSLGYQFAHPTIDDALRQMLN